MILYKRLLLSALLVCVLLLSPLKFHAASAEEQGNAPPTQQNQTLFTIGIVTDGNSVVDRELVSLFQKEIQLLTEGEFVVKFPDSMLLSGMDTAKGVNRAIDQLFANSKTDVILTLGTIASSELLRRTNFPKPVIAPYVIDGVIRRLPPRKEGTSGLANLTYIDSMFDMDQEIMTLQKLVPVKNLAILLDQRDIAAIPEISTFIRRLANEHTMAISGVGVKRSAEEALAAIPAGTEAVMVGPLYNLSEDERMLLIGGLIDRGLPGYSLWSRKLVESGLLAGGVPADVEEKIARRTAISVHEILLGEEAGRLQVAFARGHELTINMATARALDFYPSLAMRTGSNLLNEQRQDIDRRLTLQQAVDEALDANLELSSATHEVQAGVHSVTEARSSLLPRINIGTAARTIDEDRAALGGGSAPERAWTASVGGSQQLYSEKSWAGYRVEQHRQTGRMMDLATVRLDVMYEASVSYFNVLLARSIDQLYKSNLKLTQANLERARVRMSTGVAGPDEVYRWETKFATDKITVLEKEATTLDAMAAMNRILNRPLQEEFIAEETDLSDPLLIVDDRLFFDLMSNPKYLGAFRDFAIEEALTHRPELKVVDAAIAAQKRLKTASDRSFWLPDFTLEGQVEEYIGEDGAGQRGDFPGGLDSTDWQVGVYARLPLFEGGRKYGSQKRNSEELAQLKIERRALAERIGQDMLRALNRTRSSYPGISLSREAAESANRSLVLITDAYTQGIKSIIDLLDAQNQALTADKAAANAVYHFLIDLMGVQRAMGEFILFLAEAERNGWRERAEQYIRNASEPISVN